MRAHLWLTPTSPSSSLYVTLRVPFSLSIPLFLYVLFPLPLPSLPNHLPPISSPLSAFSSRRWCVVCGPVLSVRLHDLFLYCNSLIFPFFPFLFQHGFFMYFCSIFCTLLTSSLLLLPPCSCVMCAWCETYSDHVTCMSHARGLPSD